MKREAVVERTPQGFLIYHREASESQDADSEEESEHKSNTGIGVLRALLVERPEFEKDKAATAFLLSANTPDDKTILGPALVVNKTAGPEGGSEQRYCVC